MLPHLLKSALDVLLDKCEPLAFESVLVADLHLVDEDLLEEVG
jgi:hypothetical protein